MYAFGVGDGILFIALSSDDRLMVWKIKKAIDHVKGKLQEKFDLKALGVAIFLLGRELRRKEGGDKLMVQ